MIEILKPIAIMLVTWLLFMTAIVAYWYYKETKNKTHD